MDAVRSRSPAGDLLRKFIRFQLSNKAARLWISIDFKNTFCVFKSQSKGICLSQGAFCLPPPANDVAAEQKRRRYRKLTSMAPSPLFPPVIFPAKT